MKIYIALTIYLFFASCLVFSQSNENEEEQKLCEIREFHEELLMYNFELKDSIFQYQAIYAPHYPKMADSTIETRIKQWMNEYPDEYKQYCSKLKGLKQKVAVREE